MDDRDNNRLDDLLNGWHVDPKVPPSLQGNVWRQIEANHLRTLCFGDLLAQFKSLFERPKITTFASILFLLLGGSTGYLHAQKKVQESATAIKQQYWRSVDPYLQANGE